MQQQQHSIQQESIQSQLQHSIQQESIQSQLQHSMQQQQHSIQQESIQSQLQHSMQQQHHSIQQQLQSIQQPLSTLETSRHSLSNTINTPPQSSTSFDTSSLTTACVFDTSTPMKIDETVPTLSILDPNTLMIKDLQGQVRMNTDFFLKLIMD